MSIFNIISMAGGLALFLYGMNMLSASLENLSGGLLETILKKMTSNVLLGILLGTVVTATIQSSGATMVIVIGLVNAGLLKLRGAIGIVLGSSIGTTITAQILRLTELENATDANVFLQLLKPSCLTAVAAVAGFIIFTSAKQSKRRVVGEIFLGFSILFTGMLAMETAIKPLSEVPWVSELFAGLSNPVLGILVGAIFTAIVQSSSVSIGILQSLSTTVCIPFASAFPIIIGQNIGACATPFLATIGANKNAKRVSIIQIYSKILGCILFIIPVYLLESVFQFDFWNEAVDKGIIANFHTIFNVVITLMLLPFTKLLEKLAMATIREKKTDIDGEQSVAAEDILDDRFLNSPQMALTQAHKTVMTMAKYAQYNFRESRKLFNKFDKNAIARINEFEDNIDKMDDKVNNYLLKVSNMPLTAQENRTQTMLFHLAAEYERIGDYANNLMESAQKMHEKGLVFSDSAAMEIDTLYNAVDEIIQLSITAADYYTDQSHCKNIEPLEEIIDSMEGTIKARHIQRFKKGLCGVEVGIVLVDTLTNLERIGDHCSNISTYIISANDPRNDLNTHEYVNRLHNAEDENYRVATEKYENMYRI